MQMAEGRVIKERLNILIIGEKGSGKSTLVDVIKYCLAHIKLIDSIKPTFVCKARYITQNIPQLIEESTFVGNDIEVHLIDTPGFEKTCDMKWNTNIIISNIINLTDIKIIHGILILLRLNNLEYEDFLKMCINEIHLQFGRTACGYITFVFTKNQSCNYQVECMLPHLKRILKELELTDLLTVREEIVFCLEHHESSIDHIKYSQEIERLIENIRTRTSQPIHKINVKHYLELNSESKSAYYQPNASKGKKEIPNGTPNAEQSNSTKESKQKDLRHESKSANHQPNASQSDKETPDGTPSSKQSNSTKESNQKAREGSITQDECSPAPKALYQMNILVLGETSVGKSTWINGLANYLNYKTLQEAMDQKPVYLIPSSYIINTEDYEEILVPMGECNTEDDCEVGQSVTQMPKTYSFESGQVRVCFIDTPGIGDTRGLEYDKKNFEYIMCHLSHLEKLHGICILLKPGQALTASFELCFKELLKHLHKDACKNIVFVFTNARSSNFKPGDTLPLINEILSKNNLKDVLKINSNRVYFVDNEAIRFLAALQAGIAFSKEDHEMYAKSWLKSYEESQRLILFISNLKPHSARQTVSLNDVRRTIFALAQPLAQVSENIQENVSKLEIKMKEIQQLKEAGESLRGKLSVPKVVSQTKKIEHPRLICTSEKCTEIVNDNGENIENYKQCCHQKCYMKGMTFLNNIHSLVKLCKVFKNDICTICGCSWKNHMRITYECIRRMEYIVNRDIEEKLKKTENDEMAIELCIQVIQQRIDQMQQEQQKIVSVSALCGLFIEQNSTLVKEDIMADSLQQIIDIEKNVEKCKALEDVQKCYYKVKEQVNLSVVSMTPFEIKSLLHELYELPLNGYAINDCLQSAQKATSQIAKSEEVIHRIKQSFIAAIGATLKFVRKLKYSF